MYWPDYQLYLKEGTEPGIVQDILEIQRSGQNLDNLEINAQHLWEKPNVIFIQA